MKTDGPDPAHQRAAREMWQSLQIQGDQLDLSLKRALDPGCNWKSLVPELSVDGESASAFRGLGSLDADTIVETARRFADEGYLQLAPMLPLPTMTRMCGAVARLEAADWPPVFTWVYDEFWRASRVPPLTALFESILGPGYRQTPYIWTHVVAGRRGAAGWPPHVDCPGDALRMTVWIPLTDATVETGCMCLIPRHLVPASQKGRWHDDAAMPTRDVLALLHASRPLPARAGSALAWDARVLHWGLARQAEGDPRISLSMELVPSTAEPSLLADTILAIGATLPTLDQRLQVIARAIVLYQRNEPRVARYLPLADRLIGRVERSGS